MAKKGMKHYYTRKPKDSTGSADEIPAVFPAIDNDLAAENLENDFDMTSADLHELK